MNTIDSTKLIEDNRYIMLELTPEEAEAVKDAVMERLRRLREQAAGMKCFSRQKAMLKYVLGSLNEQ